MKCNILHKQSLTLFTPAQSLVNNRRFPVRSFAAKNWVRAKTQGLAPYVQESCTLQLGCGGFTTGFGAEIAADGELQLRLLLQLLPPSPWPGLGQAWPAPRLQKGCSLQHRQAPRQPGCFMQYSQLRTALGAADAS